MKGGLDELSLGTLACAFGKKNSVSQFGEFRELLSVTSASKWCKEWLVFFYFSKEIEQISFESIQPSSYLKVRSRRWGRHASDF